nr:immunoglobulin light chain junction region [Macaca mulatta]MOY10292.1 immunoglobulin light chain junction region [Macaca mulatta]
EYYCMIWHNNAWVF